MVLPRVCSRLYVPLLLAVCATLALGAASGDSPTIDEPGHLVAGLAVWHEGDFRMAPDHPPLARLWAALPVFLGSHAWQTLGRPGWSDGDWWRFGRWLFERNDPEALLWPARAMMVGLLVATCLATWWVARSLFGPTAGALALLLAAFDPGFLAHGHYVTTDMPMTLATLACLFDDRPRTVEDRHQREPTKRHEVPSEATNDGLDALVVDQRDLSPP